MCGHCNSKCRYNPLMFKKRITCRSVNQHFIVVARLKLSKSELPEFDDIKFLGLKPAACKGKAKSQ